VVDQAESVETFDLSRLREYFASAKTDGSAPDTAGIEILLTRLEAKHGNNVPISEMTQVQIFIDSQLKRVRQEQEEAISRGAQEGKAISVEALRTRMAQSKAAYAGSDASAYSKEIDKMLDYVATKYGSQVPIDEAFRLMRNLEEGRGFETD
jgi:hypothetical protein